MRWPPERSRSWATRGGTAPRSSRPRGSFPCTRRCMGGSWAPELLALVRPRNLLLSAAGVAIGGVLAQGRAAFPPVVLWAMASAIGLGAAGNVANDLFDR